MIGPHTAQAEKYQAFGGYCPGGESFVRHSDVNVA